MTLTSSIQASLPDLYRISWVCGPPPYSVETIKYGPQYKHIKESPPQVVDSAGNVAVVSIYGQAFLPNHEWATVLCDMANNGSLKR